MVQREQQSTHPPMWDEFQGALLMWPRLLEEGVKFQRGVLEAIQETWTRAQLPKSPEKRPRQEPGSSG